MLRFATVKQTARVAARFLLTILGALVVISLLGLVRRYVTGYTPDGATIVVGRALLDALRGAVLPAVGASVILALFDVLRNAERPALPLLALFVLAAASAVAAVTFLGSPSSDPSPVQPSIPSERVVQYEEILIYSLGRAGLQIGPGVVYDRTRRPGFQTFQEAVLLPQTDELRIPRIDATYQLGTPLNAYPAMVDVPSGIAPIMDEIATLNRILLAGDGPALVLALAVSLYLVSCWTLVRLSRWPAFNAVLAVGAVRALIWTVAAIEQGPLTSLAIAVLTSARLWLAEVLIVGSYAAVLILVGVLLPPLRDWKREVS